MENKTNNVRVYTTPSCPYCYMVKEFLNPKGVVFEEVNVAEDQMAAYEMVKKTGRMAVPVIEIRENLVIGFDRERMEELLA